MQDIAIFFYLRLAFHTHVTVLLTLVFVHSVNNDKLLPEFSGYLACAVDITENHVQKQTWDYEIEVAHPSPASHSCDPSSLLPASPTVLMLSKNKITKLN